MTQLAANTIADADEFAPMLSELKAEALRRYDLFTASGVNNITNISRRAEKCRISFW